MQILPAIDLINGQAVRLVQGDYNQKTVYNPDPVSVAKGFEEAGATFIHVVDLDGAKAGKPVNTQTISNIAKSISIPFEVGGGIRTIEDIETVLNAGASRVILGSSIIKNPEMTKEALKKYGGEKIVIGIDAKGGKVAIEGWLDTTDVDAFELAAELEKHGAKTVIYTDIAKDGMMQGPNLEELSKLADKVSLNIIASGGVSSIQNVRDLKELKKENLNDCIIGKAIYTGDIDLKEAIEVGNG